jgi:hypothetical protein
MMYGLSVMPDINVGKLALGFKNSLLLQESGAPVCLQKDLGLMMATATLPSGGLTIQSL